VAFQLFNKDKNDPPVNNKMALKFQKMQVFKVVKETEDAITIYFQNPDKQLYSYIPGQYLTLRAEINGKAVNRAFSLCSSPITDDLLAVTVKKTTGGLVSTYFIQNLKAGDTLEVLPPLGNFVAKLKDYQKKHYVLIGAGSGITPLMSILKTALEVEKESKVTLIFGNRNTGSIIFKSSLEALQTQYPDRLKVIHVLTQADAGWTGPTGRLTRGKVKELLQPVIDKDSLIKEYYVCGPSAMMDESLHALKEMRVPAENTHQEHFSAPITHPMDEPEKPAAAAANQKEGMVKIILEGKEYDIEVGSNSSILEAALDNDLDPPYACMIGSCCTCKAKLLSGKVIMDDREGLTDEEIREGFVLTCQSHPTTPNVIVSYDEI
jgi:ring-1,2-phenylacetyl-CoA epoxidase subunit PaaE